jgi:penicillin amidase/acyl-homoserine-lactone acylase
LLSFLIIGAGMFAFRYIVKDSPDLATIQEEAEQTDHDVRILRDVWGVPHVFGVTDPDVAYGFAYAHAEDDFETIQKSMLAARGRLASVFGRDHAPNDYMVQAMRIRDSVESKYASDLSPQVRAICEAYAEGLNKFARLHPGDALPGLFPVTGEDVVAGYVHKIPLFFGLHKALKELFEPERKHNISTKELAFDLYSNPGEDIPYGSNAFAIAPGKTRNGETFLAINSHQPWEGPLTWYEAHLHSQEGWDIVGSTFPAGPFLVQGMTPDLGWGFTVNHPDQIDIYVLKVNPDNPSQYLYDGEWLDFEVDQASIDVKLIAPIEWEMKEEILWSVYGPAVMRPHGTYAIRYAGMGDIRHVEQLFQMNKAGDFVEWRKAMALLAIPKFNAVYADRSGNIFYLYNGLLPQRAEGYDWAEYLPGTTSETLWNSCLPFDELPQVLNPASGFIQSCNNSPFQTTVGPENPDPERYSGTFGIESQMTNRAYRALELLGQDDVITEEEFYACKYDMAYSPKSLMASYISRILALPLPDVPMVHEAVHVLRTWDYRTDLENDGAALAILTVQPFVMGKVNDPTDEDLLTALTETAQKLKRDFGRIRVPWQVVNRLMRGRVDLGVGGGPDVLRAIYGRKMSDGRLQAYIGDCYILMGTWDKNGKQGATTIHQYGSATSVRSSPHYADQAPLFVEQKMRPVWRTEEEIRANLESEYRPGEELLRFSSKER